MTMGQEELVLKVGSDSTSPSKHQHRREPSNSSGARISNSSASSSPTRRKDSFVKVKFCRQRDPIMLKNEDSTSIVEGDSRSLSAEEPSSPSSHCDRLCPTNTEQEDSKGMLPNDGKSQSSDYGSFCNTPSGLFTGASTVVEDSPSSNSPSRTKGDDLTANESINPELYQHQPLLSIDIPSDSSLSEDDVGNANGYTRRKAKSKSSTNNTGGSTGGHVLIHMENEAPLSEESLSVPGEPLKTLIAFIFLAVAWIATTTSLALTHERVPDVNPLPDIFLDNVVYQSWGLDTSEILIIISMWMAFIVVLCHNDRFVILRRIFLIIGIHYYYRAITMYITVLPKADPNYKCAPKLDKMTFLEIAQRVLKLLSGMGLSINGQHIYCGDYIYSGHTMSLIMTYLVIKEYSPKRWFLLHWFSLIITLTGIITLLLARGHYSIDVLIAYYITTRLWWIYHTLAHNQNLRVKSDEENYLGSMWWFPIFQYFEKMVPAKPLTREYSLPIPTCIMGWWESRQSRSSASSIQN
ncbi:phosphatidylcholine:ceramide cholinephosphotransferase 2 isoform X1 [Lepeophtheirus salmonis]|uniref:Phosphatidylcholine:ceramide cholinephosphotransferase 1like [Megachile rotundata] n=1 Tax=Lepeophtheirus salmonis TaxID=72036 RepID=A0A0K2SXB8_LEPSM|nr:phosphatidylcholine:ceramide cholinephosphotransferase 2-like isoform X1 [Lepeophtheirus salmonis]XP_040581562.1 phosphatidylcholine:ceramide cholinephosphotransferase 2-like isoform X1 [Lepeophtheirus salmonis]